jgi:hypothetical protein
MCRKSIFLVLALGFCLTVSVQAATIIWVSDNKDLEYPDPVIVGPRDEVWTDLLEANGYTVDMSFSNTEGQTLDAAKIDALNRADLIIISRNTDSGFLICETPTGNDDRDIRYDAAGGDTGGTNCMKYGITTTDSNPEDENPSDTQTKEWQHVAAACRCQRPASRFGPGQ